MDVLVFLAMLIGLVLVANAPSSPAMKPNGESWVISGKTVSGPLLQEGEAEARIGKRHIIKKKQVSLPSFSSKKLGKFDCEKAVDCEKENCPPDLCYCSSAMKCRPPEDKCYEYDSPCSSESDPCLLLEIPQFPDVECDCDLGSFNSCKPRGSPPRPPEDKCYEYDSPCSSENDPCLLLEIPEYPDVECECAEGFNHCQPLTA